MLRTYSLTKVAKIQKLGVPFSSVRHGIKADRKQKLKREISNAQINKMSVCF